VSAAIFPSDEHPQNYIAGAVLDGDIVGVATVFPESPPNQDLQKAWRLRGMAVRQNLRGQGIGALLLKQCFAHIASHGGQCVWCNARTPVLGFYGQLGFGTVGEEFDIPVSGPHYFMLRSIP